MAPSDYLQRFWLYFATFGTVVILLAAGVYVVETLPPRKIVMATGAQGGAYHELGIRYRQLLAEAGIELQLVPTTGAIENLTRLRDPRSRVDVGFIQGRDHHSEGITRGGVAGHAILRAAVVLHPYQWQSYRRNERPTIFDWSRGKRNAKPGAPTV